MDAKVDDFLNEINEIAPPIPSVARAVQPKVVKNVPEINETCVWQKCYDELTGFSYYWNTKTDQVTWNTPEDYKETKMTKSDIKKRPGMYVPPKVTPLFPGISTATAIPQESIKIYSIGESSSNKNIVKDQQKVSDKTLKRPHKKNSDSEDEKIILISSYGSDTGSEDEEPEEKKTKNVTDQSLSVAEESALSEEEDDLDILAKIQKKAKELKELGGDLPPGVKEVVSTVKDALEPPPKNKMKTISGFSLVAGYSDSEEENEEIKTVFQTELVPSQSHSTLFPISKPVDVKDFIPPKIEDEIPQIENDFNNKAFKRKKRIGVALVNTVKKKNEGNMCEERKGFGFEKDLNPEVSISSTSTTTTTTTYPGFQKGGVMFVKSDILNPTIPAVTREDEIVKTCEIDDQQEVGIDRNEVDGMYSTLREKLVFLNVGSSAVSVVQTMVIQAETLFSAMNEGGLKLSYLQKWLKEMCSELVKLEKEATPDGWLLQWDRSNKRYYYQNLATGASQWEYPQPPDPNASDDAMDISTTPPPPIESAITMSPPLPPTIRSPTPPPPPIISVDDDAVSTSVPADVPLPPEQPPLPKVADNGEPLPPGVDLPDMVAYPKPQVIFNENSENSTDDTLNSALDSFYSDIAAIDPVAVVLPPTQSNEEKPPDGDIQMATESLKKKKKAKVKLGPGLTMKKKGVSQLVEKWKNVQQHYND
ncbi:unnamed protein product [Phaedon cochleariae]|uniref:WW domain-containing protein n=1 Tax=Phaedon cochleariae TaxID=80249 RepID=A0A9P0DTE6_PHACE|nr:unnamed protein product [Phaedon cochleariae]